MKLQSEFLYFQSATDKISCEHFKTIINILDSKYILMFARHDVTFIATTLDNTITS